MTYNQKDAQMLIQGDKRALVVMNTFFTMIIMMIIAVVLWATLGESADKWTIIFGSVAALLILGVVVGISTTKKLRSDLSSGNTVSKVVAVKSIIKTTDVGAGSGAMYIPILGSLFPKLFGQKMKEVNVAYLVTEDNERYEISADVDERSKTLTLYFAEKSGIYLGCAK